MTGSVFPRAALDRAECSWADHLYAPTPVELRDGRWYKREDYFAPLGYGGINGSKLRQLVYLVGDYVAGGGRAGLLTGASVLSPQVSMSALVARHYDLPSLIVLGASKPESARRHENVAIALDAGADFRFIPVGFNPALQRAVADLHASEYSAWFRLCYGITTAEDADPEEVASFHDVGARQAPTIPDAVRTLVMTAGSCNSCVSVLYGIALAPPAGLERVVLLGVGPTRLQWIERRLEAVEAARGVHARALFRRRYHDHPDLEEEHQTDGPLLLEHYDLHSTGYATYGDRMPWTEDGIEFHPTYEGKAMNYMAGHPDFDWFRARAGDALFWIVGSAPSRRAMSDAFILGGVYG